MSSIVRLALHSKEDSKVTPLEVLRDFADATAGWSYLEADSRHYAEVKNAPGLVIRHRADPSTFVDLGFVQTSPSSETVQLAVLDRPSAGASLSTDDRSSLLDRFLGVMQAYLRNRTDQVTLEIEKDHRDPAAS